MANYQTIDSIPDLTYSQMRDSIVFNLDQLPASSDADRQKTLTGLDLVPVNRVYKFSASEGSSLAFLAMSFFDPDLVVYDKDGNAILRNLELDDFYAKYLLPADLWSYSIDVEVEFKAPYSGDYYIKPSFFQGAAQQNKAWALVVQEAFDKEMLAKKDVVYVFKSEKTGPGVAPNSHSYFYTVNSEEAAFIRSQPQMPWVEKTATFEAAHSNPGLSVPVHRFFSEKYQSHFFTISNEEKNQIMDWSSTGKNGYDWRYEGEGFRVYTDPTPKDALGKSAVPVYRMWINDKDFNPGNGESGGHYFTADKAEYESMVKLTGVNGEGFAFYGEVLGA